MYQRIIVYDFHVSISATITSLKNTLSRLATIFQFYLSHYSEKSLQTMQILCKGIRNICLIYFYSNLQLQVSDKDSRNGGRVDYQGAMVVNVMRNDIALSVNQFVSYFAVSQQGQVYLTQTLDREEADSYYVVVTAVDRGRFQ